MRKKIKGGSSFKTKDHNSFIQNAIYAQTSWSSFGLGIITAFLGVIMLIIVYLFVNKANEDSDEGRSKEKPWYHSILNISNTNNGTNNIFEDPYKPPLKYDHMMPPLSMRSNTNSTILWNDGGLSTQGPLVLNYPTQGFNGPFTQVGILTKTDHEKEVRSKCGGKCGTSKEDTDTFGGDTNALILPLMGRKLASSNSKMQYYAISNTGAVNTKLPIRKQGKNCVGEYGCDEIYDNDTVFVDGYRKPFRVTLYENASFAYIPI